MISNENETAINSTMIVILCLWGSSSNRTGVVRVLYSDNDMEEMTIDQLKRYVKEQDRVKKFRDDGRKRYVLPLHPPILPSHEEEGRLFAISKHSPLYLLRSDSYFATKNYHRDDNWRMDFENPVEYNPRGRPAASTKKLGQDLFWRLNPGKFVNDEAINFFASKFNEQEREKFQRDPEYRPGIMFSTHLIPRLVKPDGRFTRDERWCYLGFKLEGVKQKAAKDIFTSTSHLYFPYNITETHWALFVVDPNTLKQKYFDSLHWRLNSDADGRLASQKIHQLLLEYHEATMGKPHPNHRMWSRSMYQDDGNVLGTAKQTGEGMDCGLHTCINVVWNQESIPRWILKEDPSKVSKELRLRMILTIARDEWFFGISKKAVEQMNKKRSKKRPVDQSESLVPHIEQLSKEVKRAYVKKENNQN